MIVKIQVMLKYKVTLPETAVCRVEVRDVTYLDAPSITLRSHEVPASKIIGQSVLKVDFVISESEIIGRNINVWAHLSLTGEKRIQLEDYITTHAYPVISGASEVRVVVELQPVSRASHQTK